MSWGKATAFVRRRLSRGSYLGFSLTLGATILVAAAWLFGGIAEDVVTSDPLTVLDEQVAEWFHARSTPGLTNVMLAISDAHDVIGITIMASTLALWLLYKRNWYWLLALALTVPGGMLLNVAMKHAFRRARPSFTDPLLTLATYSFPSGHTAAAMLFYGTFGALLLTQIKNWLGRVLLVILLGLVVALVGLSRLYLGLHYLSDVLAAVALSVAWLALCLTAVNTVRGRGSHGA